MLSNNQAAQQAVLMPVPVTRKCKQFKAKKDKKCKAAVTINATPEEIEIVQESVVKYSSRLHVTSAVLIAIGVIGAFGSAYHGLHARHIATKLLNKPIEQPLNYTSTAPQSPEFVSADMFALVDNIRIISFILFLTSMSIAALGKMAIRSTHKLKAKFSQRVFKRSICRIVLAVFLLHVAKGYIKECKQIVKNNNDGLPQNFNNTMTHGRKLMSVEGDEINVIEEFEQAWAKEEAEAPSAKDLIDSLRGKKSHHKKDSHPEEKPAWMKKGLFDIEPKEINSTYTFEKESDEETVPNKKHHNRGHNKNKKHHSPCLVITILAVVLIACHLYQLKHLAKSLVTLQAMGAKAKKEQKECKNDKKNKQSAVVAAETVQEVPSEINYSFSEHSAEDCEQVYQFPVVQQPAPTYIINERHDMC